MFFSISIQLALYYIRYRMQEPAILPSKNIIWPEYPILWSHTPSNPDLMPDHLLNYLLWRNHEKYEINSQGFQMEYNNQMFKNNSSHKKYARISSEKRSKLISRVLEQGISVVKASKKLGIKISTAKLILKKYKETGAIFQKKMPNYKRKDLRDALLDTQEQKEAEDGLNMNEVTSMEQKFANEQQQGEVWGEGEPAVGIYWVWPVFYYQN